MAPPPADRPAPSADDPPPPGLVEGRVLRVDAKVSHVDVDGVVRHCAVRGKLFEDRWLHRAALLMGPSGLVAVIAGVGLSALTGWLDYALFPLMFFSLAVVAQALWLRAGRPGPTPKLWATALAAVLSALIIWLEFRFALRITIGAFLAIGLYAIFLNRTKSKGVTQ